MAPFLFGLYWKRATLAGVKAGMLVGLILAVWLYFALGSKLAPMAASIAILAPFIVVPAVSLMTGPPSARVLEKAFLNIK
jgi:SSS family solute:Na+ symporter